MAAAFEWIQTLFQVLFDFFPHRVIVPATHRGVLWRRGSKVLEKKAGGFWYWPFVSEYTLHPIGRQTTRVNEAGLSLPDGTTFSIASVIVWHIDDIVLAIGEKNWDIDHTVWDITLASTIEVAMQTAMRDYDKPGEDGYRGISEAIALGDTSEMYIDLLNLCRERLTSYGIGVEKIFICEYSVADKVYKHQGIEFNVGS